jgi:hypothetical protein
MGPGSKSAKANVSLSTADFALAYYVALMAKRESSGLDQLHLNGYL